MVETRENFIERNRALARKHAMLASDHSTLLDRSGLYIAAPKRQRRQFPMNLLLMFLLGFIGFKAFMVASVGPMTYNARLSELENGTVIERAGALAFAIDPVTNKIAGIRGPLLR